MNIQFEARGFNLPASLKELLSQQLHRLETLADIESAKVILEKQLDHAPAFHAHVHLAVPGPDIHAAARDHTMEAAWLKVTTNLRQQIEQRKSRQGLRLKDRHQPPMTGNRWVSTRNTARG